MNNKFNGWRCKSHHDTRDTIDKLSLFIEDETQEL